MANRLFHTQRTLNNGSIILAGYVTVTSGGHISTTLTTEGRGVSASWTATGEITFTLNDKYKEIVHADVKLLGASAAERRFQVTSRTPSTRKIVAQCVKGTDAFNHSVSLPATTALGTLSQIFAYSNETRSITDAKIVFPSTVALNASNFFIAKANIRSAAGATITWWARLTSSVVTHTAYVPRGMTLGANGLAANGFMTLNMTKVGAGVATPAGGFCSFLITNIAAVAIPAGKVSYLFVCRNSTLK